MHFSQQVLNYVHKASGLCAARIDEMNTRRCMLERIENVRVMASAYRSEELNTLPVCIEGMPENIILTESVQSSRLMCCTTSPPFKDFCCAYFYLLLQSVAMCVSSSSNALAAFSQRVFELLQRYYSLGSLRPSATLAIKPQIAT